MQFITDVILSASEFAECYSGCWFTHCATYTQMKNCLSSVNIWVSKPIPLAALTEKVLTDNNYYAFVEFLPEDTSKPCYCGVMRIQKKYVHRFSRAVKENYEGDRI